MRDSRALSSLRRAALVVAAIALGSCSDGEKSHRGIELMPDMFDSPGYRRQVAMVVTDADGHVHHWPAVMPPVAGTVSRAGPGYQLALGDMGGAQRLIDPLTPTAAVLREGQYGFSIYCAVCHGRDGNAANGYVAKYFSGVPSLTTPKIASMADGEIYHLITLGRNRMPSYAAQLMPERRWAVIQYLRVLNRASLATQNIDAAVAADEKAVKAHPADSNAQAVLDLDRAAQAQRAKDLGAIQRLGPDSGHDFMPLPDPRPEYETPTWPEGGNQGTQEPAK